MQLHFAVGFVTYHPSPDFLYRLKLLSLLKCKVYIYDNSPEDGATRDIASSLALVSYHTAGRNLGLGIGISTVCAQAYYDNSPLLLFFDQDTVFNEDTINFIQKFIENKLEQIKNDYSTIVFNSKNYNGEDSADKFTVTNVDLVISSGSLFILKNLKKIGWHNERYFVDCVDYELCFRSLLNRLKVGECRTTPGFDHIREQPDREYKIMGITIPLRRYSSSRFIDASKASMKLIATSIFAFQPKFAFLVLRSYGIYLTAQILAIIKVR